jgi:hypothetical protein
MRLEEVAQNPLKPSVFGMIAIKIHDFLPECGQGKYTKFLKI